MKFSPRPYQEKILAAIADRFRENRRRLLVVSPTGSGKSLIFARAAEAAVAKDKAVLVLSHRREIREQICETLTEIDIQHGVIAPGHKTTVSHVQVASVQAMVRRLDRWRHFDLIIQDEAHHSIAPTFAKILNNYPEAFVLGVTATPARLDGTGLGSMFNEMIMGPQIADLISQGYLAPFRVFSKPPPDLSKVHTRAGDYAADELEAEMETPSVYGDILGQYQRHLAGKRAVLFAVSVSASKHLADAFRGVGVAAEHVDGETPDDQRAAAMARFRAGETLVLTNCSLLGEGVDVPAAEGVILARPTKSLALYLQMCGRATRTAPGKEFAVICDHGGHWDRLGPPDAYREWTLHGRQPQEKRKSPKICASCGCTWMGTYPCPVCGFQPPITEQLTLDVDPDIPLVERRRGDGPALAPALPGRGPHKVPGMLAYETEKAWHIATDGRVDGKRLFKAGKMMWLPKSKCKRIDADEWLVPRWKLKQEGLIA